MVDPVVNSRRIASRARIAHKERIDLEKDVVPVSSMRPIRALARGLEALEVLNRLESATVAEVASRIQLSRTTTYRVLETLREAGYVRRTELYEKYRLASRVRLLSAGLTEGAWVAETAQPLLDALCREVVWPLALANPVGDSMRIQATTDHHSPLAVEPKGYGDSMPLFASAAGLAYLAFCPPDDRRQLVAAAARTSKVPEDLERLLTETRRRGFAVHTRARRRSGLTTVAVPVLLGSRPVAALSLRFANSAVTLKAASTKFVPRLRTLAAQIAQECVQQQPPR